MKNLATFAIKKMQIQLKNGINQVLFGMKEKDVIALYGKPDRIYKDDDHNTILLYNSVKMRLTFYQDEDFKLGYIVASSLDLELFGLQIMGKSITEVKKHLIASGITNFTQETFDTIDNYFNEDNWFILQTEFDEVVKIEIGAIINAKDEFEWKFKK